MSSSRDPADVPLRATALVTGFGLAAVAALLVATGAFGNRDPLAGVDPWMPVPIEAGSAGPAKMFSVGRATIMRVTANEKGRFFVPVAIGELGLNMIIDTGATTVGLRVDDLEAAGLPVPPPEAFKARAETASGSMPVAMVIIPLLEIGGIRLENVKAHIHPRSARPGGVIGMSALAKLRLMEIRGSELVMVR